MLSKVLITLLVSALPTAHGTATECAQHTVDFIVLQGDAFFAAIEDEIVADLALVNITVNTRFLEREAFNAAMQDGSYNMVFSESWGPPYDPQTYATGWFSPNNEAHFSAMEQMEPPMTRATMQTMVSEVLIDGNPTTRQEKWQAILQEMHNQAIHNPLWSRRMPAIWNRRLQGYTPGPQQFDYPMHTFIVDSGSPNITVSPGSQTGLFASLGRMDPHSTRPNEFWFSNWVYESLVHYGEHGAIVPALATSWTVTDTSNGGQEYRFTLRTGVSFHDGSPWNCAAAKMNFDHVLHPPLGSANNHGWYHLPLHTTAWSCDGEVFVVEVDDRYYPFLQELSFIRPLRMLSPASFINGPATDAATENSCPATWGTITEGSHSVTCAGTRSQYGTGPWIYQETTNRSDGTIVDVLFSANRDWWGSRGNVENMRVVQYDTSDAVAAALLSEELDVMVGGGVLGPQKVRDFKTQHTSTHETVHGPPLMNQVVIMNAARSPTSDISVRKTIVHAVNKARIVATEMYGQESVADSIFPRDVPYCNIDLTPHWDYDLEKARLLNCPATTPIVAAASPAASPAASDDDDDNDLPLILGVALGVGIPLVIAVGVASFCIGRNMGYKKFNDDAKGGQRPGGTAQPDVIGTEGA